MIHVVEPPLYPTYAEHLDEMYRFRARVFSERLKWDVEVRDGRERDGFDDLGPAYLLSLSSEGRLQGGLRLLPTTGPNMLRDVFPMLMPSGEVVESATIWESSRFALDPEACAKDPNMILNPITSELLLGLIEIGQLAGLDFIATVVDARMKRVLSIADYPIDYIGTPQRVGRATAYAALLHVTQEAWCAVAMRGGITERVIAPASVARFTVDTTPLAA